MEPLWTEEDILPQQLADILEEALQSDEDDSEPEDPEFVESDDSS